MPHLEDDSSNGFTDCLEATAGPEAGKDDRCVWCPIEDVPLELSEVAYKGIKELVYNFALLFYQRLVDLQLMLESLVVNIPGTVICTITSRFCKTCDCMTG